METVTDSTDDRIADLTITDLAALGSGATFWSTKQIGAVPAILLTDGPHGLRKQEEGGDHLGMGQSVPATCFPPAVGLGSSWDVDLVHRVGEALGVETAIENVGVLLGPGVNIKRSALCGRNFEYLSEDPIVAGVLGAAYVKGVQSKGVGTSLKHFAANNQEHDRMRASSDVDPRPLREIYLRGFQRVVEDAQPWTVMCSYNRINGVYASEDPWLLTSVLRDEWGFEGLVVSDWGAVNDRVKGLAAGMDLEMPSSNGRTDAQLVAAVRDGSLAESTLDVAAARVIDLVQKVQADAGTIAGPLDLGAHHALAREAAGRSIVLLRNAPVAGGGALLPLRRDARLAVIGAFAEKPRYQGAGSSMINPTRLDTALDAIRDAATGDVTYAPGFSLAVGVDEAETAALREAAVAAASGADIAVLFLGLPARLESEGFDRTHIDLPDQQLQLLAAVVQAQPRTVAVLSHGGVVRLDTVAELAPAILDGALLGQGGGAAIADVLFGAVNPSGRLTETVPARLQDCPGYLNFTPEDGRIIYGERVFVGYRWYDARDLAVTFPFGHGLSYTSFDYDDLVVHAGTHELTVRVTVTNTGDRTGREVVQIYAGLPGSRVSRPPQWLVGFGDVTLAPGDRRIVEVAIPRNELAYWDVDSARWTVETGDYTVHAGASSRDLRLHATVGVTGDTAIAPFTLESTLGELLADPVAAPILAAAMSGMGQNEGQGAVPGGDMIRMLAFIPVGRITSLSGGSVSHEQVAQLIGEVNRQRS